jgi:hypothetical protein
LGEQTGEFPPPPPEGIFDARLLRTGKSGQVLLGYSSLTGRLHVTWNPGDFQGSLYARVPGGSVVQLRPGEPVVLSLSSSGTLEIITNSLSAIPASYSLSAGYPNPFNPESRFEFGLPATSVVRLVLFDLLGREVSVLSEGVMEPGVYRQRIEGSGLSSGVYFYRMTATPVSGGSAFTAVRRIVLLK